MQRRAVVWLTLALGLLGCAGSPPSPPTPTAGASATLGAEPTPGASSAHPSSTIEPSATPRASATPAPSPTENAYAGAWVEVTADVIGATAEWTNKVELADINGDGHVDILFANGGDYESPGTPEPSRVFLNAGDGTFDEATEDVMGDLRALTRVIKVADLDADGDPDIVLGTTFQTQSQLLVGNGDGTFTNETAARLPQGPLSVGDLELGDVDADGDLDIVLADWGAGSPMQNDGGRVRLWLNDGAATFSDATDAAMPATLVGFSWDLELVDIDNDWDLDMAISCKMCPTSRLYENDGAGAFTDVTAGRLPATTNNYEFAPIDLDADGYLDLVTINDGLPRAKGLGERVFRNTGSGAFEDVTEEWWTRPHNPGHDDNVVVALDVDSDGDADFLVGSLDGPDRLHLNDGSGRLTLVEDVIAHDGAPSSGTLGLAVADLDGDARPDIVDAQGEVPGHESERVYLGSGLPPDTAPPIISGVEASLPGGVVARVHDNRTPNAPHDWREVVLRWTVGGADEEAAMTWYGENLFRAAVELPSDAGGLMVCATDAAGNEACQPAD